MRIWCTQNLQKYILKIPHKKKERKKTNFYFLLKNHCMWNLYKPTIHFQGIILVLNCCTYMANIYKKITHLTSAARILPLRSCLVVNWSMPIIILTFSVKGIRRAMHTKHVWLSRKSKETKYVHYLHLSIQH